MADEPGNTGGSGNGTGSGQAPPPDPAGGGQAPPNGSGNGTQNTGNNELSADAKALKDARDEAAANRVAVKDLKKQLDDATKRLKDIDDKDKSESQKAADRIKELEDEVKKAAAVSLRADAIASAVRNRAIDPDVVAALVSAGDKSVEDQVKDLVKSKPFLFNPDGPIDGGGGDRGRGNGGKVDMNALIRGGPPGR